MGRTKRCPGCKITQAEHNFGKFDKQCPGLVPDDEEELADEDDTAPKHRTLLWTIQPFKLLWILCSVRSSR